MKGSKKLVLVVLAFSLTVSTFAGWELLSPHPKMANIEVMGDTWFGMEYHGSSSSIFLTTKDNGVTWDTVPDFSDIFLIRVHKERIIARGIYKGFLGLYMSTDTARTWKKLTWTLPGGSSDMIVNDTSILVYVYNSSAVTSPIYRSLDTGKTWHPLPIETGEENFNGSFDGMSLKTHDKSIGAFICSVGFFISNDGGDTWTQHNEGLPADITGSGPLSVMDDGYYLRYNYTWYKFNGNSWDAPSYKGFVIPAGEEEWVEEKSGLVKPNICAYRAPYAIAISGDPGGYLYYSLDNGKKWFRFSDFNAGFLNVFATSVIINGNYVYAGFDNGFARRSLSEAKNYTIKEKKEENNYPVSPEELKDILGLLGADELEELLEQLGIDSEDLSAEEMKDFLNDYLEDDGNSELPDNSQPGSCNYMGMPLWSMNVANLKMFFRDMIFRKNGVGPETKLAINYVHSADTTVGIFGKHWCFEYESRLVQNDSSVLLTTGTGAVFVFSEDKPVVTGASSFTLPCKNNDKYSLHWNGASWKVEKGMGFEFLNFVSAGSNLYLLSSVEDNYGKKLSISYNVQNKPVMVTDASGRNYVITYNNNLCDSLKLPDGRNATFKYNTRNLLISSTDFNKIETKYVYDLLRNIKSVDISGKITTFNYSYDTDSLGMVSAVMDPEGRKIEYFSAIIDSVNRLTNVIYPGNKTLTYQMRDGMVSSMTNSAGEVKKVFYNSAGKPDSLVWYDGSQITFSYNTNGDIFSKKDKDGKITTYEYNANRKLLNEKNELGQTIYAYTYNPKNQLETITLSGNKVTTYTYDDNGVLESIKSPAGNTYTFGRDIFGNLTSYTTPTGNTMYINYGPEGFQTVGTTDFNGNEYGLSYDDNGRLKEILMPDGNKKTFVYDCCAQTGITDENGNTVSVLRDATNRVLEKTTAEGLTLPIVYDGEGFISGFTTVYGSVKNLKYNQRGQLIVISDEEGIIKYSYNPKGQPVSVIDKKGNETKMVYNDDSNLSEIIDASGNKTILSYNDNGRLSTLTNARKQVTGLVYNSAGKVSEKRLNNNSYATYSYNADGQLISFTDSSGTTTYTRNTLGFITNISYPNGLSLSFEHDANGNVIKTTYPNAFTVTSTPDKLNRITNISWGTSSIDFAYNPGGNLLSETRNNSTSTTYSYNKDNVLTDLKHLSLGIVFAEETATVQNGIITGMEVKNVPDISKIPVRQAGFSSNNLNQIDQSFFNQISIPHDADGNMTAYIHNYVNKLTASYTHDNLLSSINTDDCSVKISYDAMRYPRKIVSNGVTSHLYYDHKGRLMFETNGDGTVIKNYIYRGKRIIASQTGNEAYFYHYNRFGHTLAITGTNGNINNSYSYSGHGEITGKEETIENRFTFLGAFGSLKLDDRYIITGARVYSAQMGRYLQRDPLGIITGTNPYLYASNNPIAGIDPLGLDDQNGTVNSQGLDPSSDNDYSTAGGTSNPYADDLPYRSNDWDMYKTAIGNTLEEFSNHPITDLLPDGIANPMGIFKAIDNLSNKEYGKAAWQFVPFNNSMEAAAEYLKEKTKYVDPTRSSKMGIFSEFNNQQAFSCDM